MKQVYLITRKNVFTLEKSIQKVFTTEKELEKYSKGLNRKYTEDLIIVTDTKGTYYRLYSPTQMEMDKKLVDSGDMCVIDYLIKWVDLCVETEEVEEEIPHRAPVA